MKRGAAVLLACCAAFFADVSAVRAGLLFNPPLPSDPPFVVPSPQVYAITGAGGSVFGGPSSVPIFGYSEQSFVNILPTSTLVSAGESGIDTDDPRAGGGGSAGASTSLYPSSSTFKFPSLTASANAFASVTNAGGNTQAGSSSYAGNRGYFWIPSAYSFTFTMNLTDFSASATTQGTGDYARAVSGASFLLEDLTTPYDSHSPFSNFAFIGSNILVAESENGSLQSIDNSRSYTYSRATGEVRGYTPSIIFSGILQRGLYQYMMQASATASVSGASAYASATDPLTFELALRPVSVSAVPEPSSIALLGTGVLGLCGYRTRRRTSSTSV